MFLISNIPQYVGTLTPCHKTSKTCPYHNRKHAWKFVEILSQLSSIILPLATNLLAKKQSISWSNGKTNSAFSSRNNIIQFNDSTYLKRCHYNSDTDPLCPIFNLEDIVSSCGDNYTDVAYQVCMLCFKRQMSYSWKLIVILKLNEWRYLFSIQFVRLLILFHTSGCDLWHHYWMGLQFRSFHRRMLSKISI